MNTNPKTDSLIGFAARAGALVSGEGTCRDQLKSIRLLILALDGGCGREEYFGRVYTGPVVHYGDRYHLGRITGKSPRTVIGITDDRFAKSIKESLNMKT